MVNRNKLLLVVLVLILWEIIVVSGIYPVALMPSLRDIFTSFMDHGMELLSAVLFSLYMILKGLTLASIAAAVLTILSGRYVLWQDWVSLMIKVFHPIPGIALLPLIVLWFGIGELAVTMILIHAALWPMVINLQMEYARVKKDYGDVMKAYRLPPFKRLTKVYLPGCLPGILTGLRIGWNRAWRGFISAEMIYSVIGDHSGLGWFIFERRVYMDTAGLMAGLLAVVICSITVETLILDRLEKRTIKLWAI